MKHIYNLFLILAIGMIPFLGHAKLNVVASLPDYGAIAQEIGGDHIKVTTLARGTEDQHFVDPRPSYVRVLNQADLLIQGGAELELGWLPTLMRGARNGRIQPGAPGHLVLATKVTLRDLPVGPIDRSMGDVHALGNPHLSLDPANGRLIAIAIAETLARLDSKNAPVYRENLAKFNQRLDLKMQEWDAAMKPYRGTKVVTYHKSYDYFLARYGLELAGTIESKPGIEPSPSYINGLVSKLKGAEVKLVLIEPFRPSKTPKHLAEAIGAKLLVLPGAVGGNEKAGNYFALFDENIAQITTVLKQSK